MSWAKRLLGALLGLGLGLAGPVQAVEPARDFLEALRAQGYYDMALEYLDRMAASPLAPIALKETLLYEKAVTLLQASQRQRDPALREQQLDECQQMLRQFVNQRGDHPVAASARNQLANLFVERARLKLARATKDPSPQLLKQAYDLYGQAFKDFNSLKEELRKQLERIPKQLDERDPQQARMIERRDQLRTDYLQSQLLAAATREEMADSVKAGSKEHTQLLEEARKLYGEIYEKYGNRLAGLYARLYEGRTWQKAGKPAEALKIYEELLDQPDSPEEFRRLKTKTMLYAMQCWLDPSQKKFAPAVDQGAAWVAKARPADDREPDWLAIRLLLAKAYHGRAQAARRQKGKNKPDDRTIKQWESAARQQAQFVARFESDYQREAQELVMQLGGPARTAERQQPRTFFEARDAGRDALDAARTARLVVERVPGRIAKEKDPKVKQELQQQLEEAQRTLETSADDALAYFRTALELADEETSSDDLNVVRYFLAYLYYQNEAYYDAAVVSEFVARRFPNSAPARQCAKIALAAYLKLYGAAPAADRAFETDHVIGISRYIVQQWPSQPEAADAIKTLVPLLIAGGQYEEAFALIEKIPAGSPQRLEAELKLGQALWVEYLTKSKEKEASGAGAEETSLRERAEKLLVAGTKGLKAGQMDETAVAAVLALAQLYVETNRPAEALALLDHKEHGALVLAEKGHPAAADPKLSEEIYKTGLRASIGSLSGAQDPSAVIERARQIMDAMSTSVGDTAEGKKRLVTIYVSLARDLEDQLNRSTPEQCKALSEGFESFLRQIREGATELSVLNWVAETLITLGAGVDDGSGENEQAKSYYEQAAETFQQILDQPDLDEQVRIQIQLRKADALRRMGRFKDAVDAYETILRNKPTMLTVQIEAARTYQQWAELPGKSSYYDQAILGDRPDAKTKRNIIWGWARIAEVTARYPQYRDAFHEARYNLALSRFRQALAKQGQDQKSLLGRAEQDIILTHRLYGLGNEPWPPKYDALLRQIQQKLGKPAVGVQALERTTAKDEEEAGNR